MNRLDLDMYLNAHDNTNSVFSKVTKKFNKLSAITGKLGLNFASMASRAQAAFNQAIGIGSRYIGQIDDMAEALGLAKGKASELYNIILQSNAFAPVGRVSDSVLKLTKAFADARRESGALHELIKDFGFDVNLDLEDPNLQLAEFLKLISRLEGDTAKMGAAMDVLGKANARAFSPLIRDAKLLQSAMDQLNGLIATQPEMIPLSQQQALADAAEAVESLNHEWSLLSQTLSSVVAPAFTLVKNISATFVRGMREGINELLGLGDAVVIPLQAQFNEISRKKFEAEEKLQKAQERIAKGARRSVYGRDTVREQTEAIQGYNAQLEALDKQLKALAKTRADAELTSGTNDPSGTNTSEPELSRIEKIIRDAHRADLVARAFRPPPVNLNDQVNLTQTGFVGPDDGFNEITSPNGFGEIPSQAEMMANSLGKAKGNLDALAGAFGNFATAAGKGNEKAFRTFQKFQVAISTAAAISGALQIAADPATPALAKFGAYTSALAAFMTGVRQLKAIKIGGNTTPNASTSNIGSAGAIGGQQQQPQIQQPRRQVNVTIQGNGPFTADQIEDLIDAINDNDGTLIRSDRVAT